LSSFPSSAIVITNMARRASRTPSSNKGFTIVELLIVIVVIAILAAITVVAYNGIQNSAKNTATQSAVKQVQKLVEAYAAKTGSYPSTGGLSRVYTDSGCALNADSDGQETAEWVPGLSIVSAGPLPQSNFQGTGRNGEGGCYAYASDGTVYIISAWNAKYGGPSVDGLYRRLGFREASNFGGNLYYCNHVGAIGGIIGGSYNPANDFYKHSYIVSNVTNCDETPPAGA